MDKIILRRMYPSQDNIPVLSNLKDKKMKPYFFFLNCFIISLFLSCSKENNNNTGTGPRDETPAYSNADLVGQWSGTSLKGIDTTKFTITCNDTLGLSGEGLNSEGRLVVRGKWSLSTSGKISDGGYYGYFYGSNYSNAWAEWTLQLSSSKGKLTGVIDCAVSSKFDSAAVSLIKK